MTIKSFRDLRVGRAAMDVVESVYRFTRGFPRHEAYTLTSQIRRAAISVPSNIAEGHTREHSKEFLHYLSLAQASLAELETQLEITRRLEYITSAELIETSEQLSSVGKQLYALRNALLTKDADP